MNTDQPYDFFIRQKQLPEVGVKGQRQLSKAKVLVVGAGGLGCPAIEQLASAGVGCIGIMDHDRVEGHNLHRQTLYSSTDIGRPKSDCAAERIMSRGFDLSVHSIPKYLDQMNVADILSGYDCIIDGTDNFETRYLINDFCVQSGKPWVYGSVFRFEGQVGMMHVPLLNGFSMNYRDLFPEPPTHATIPACDTAGAMGIVTALTGTFQATEAIKWIIGAGNLLTNRLLCFNLLKNDFHIIQTGPDISATKAKQPIYHLIDAETFSQLLTQASLRIIDVRGYDETPPFPDSRCIRLPLPEFSGQDWSNTQHPVVLICSHGTRSRMAALWLQEQSNLSEIYVLDGGIQAYFQSLHV